jgi:general stress protein 26
MTSITDIEVRTVPPELVLGAIAKRSYAVVATVSEAGHPHAAGIVYAAVGSTLYVSTDRSSRKGRNLAAHGRVGVTIPVRRVPVGGPPSAIQFQGAAEVLATDDPEVLRLVETGELKGITSHGELDRPDGCVVRITPDRTVHTYGLGMSLGQLIRHPLDGAGRTDLSAQSERRSAEGSVCH